MTTQAKALQRSLYRTCTLHLTARATGLAIFQRVSEVLRVENGRLYFDACEMLNALADD